ncbi:peptidoglycan recognition protein family protein [Streptomyces genisteinicus]|uniref:Peptidoglycan recognition protein n=1 Tax=Streptomyces genisteinicus TaxID=2768068 RepID=A0A7H0HSU4_9ACTN|nr:peptidoglycan recognition protein [Streptomyces genisteinicus]QNP63610.1 peptidoglycan recognition protein [Streptomyces genisteinicus]
MRGYLATSISVACAAALALPLVVTTGAVAAPLRAPDLPGSTQSLPLEPLARTPSARAHGTALQGLPRQAVEPFSLLGLVWENAAAELDGTVEVRTRAVGTGAWSAWQQVETHNTDHAADPGTAESESGRVRGSTAPLWVGASDGVEVRVRQADGGTAELPEGMRLELVDPGEDPPAAGAPGPAPGGATGRTPVGGLEIPELNQLDTEAEAAASGDLVVDAAAAKPYIGARPRIVTRKGWGADESLREKSFVYTSTVKAAFVHHSATGNNYTCAQAPSVIRSMYRYHVKSSGWRDLGYNFAVDKCGNIYEGRAGGVAKPVLGAHTLGFNTKSTGIAVLGTYSSSNPPAAAVTAVARLTAWKLGLHGINPKGKVTLTSGGSGKYAKGKKVAMNAVAGHRDGFVTDCPGSRLYGKLGTIRSASASYQGR